MNTFKHINHYITDLIKLRIEKPINYSWFQEMILICPQGQMTMRSLLNPVGRVWKICRRFFKMLSKRPISDDKSLQRAFAIAIIPIAV